jgi:hypothetical protein
MLLKPAGLTPLHFAAPSAQAADIRCASFPSRQSAGQEISSHHRRKGWMRSGLTDCRGATTGAPIGQAAHMRVRNTTFTQRLNRRSCCSIRIAAVAAAAVAAAPAPAHKAALPLLPLPQLLPPAHMAALVAEVEEPQIRARLLWMDGQEGFDVPQRGRHALT